jgi:endoglucanase
MRAVILRLFRSHASDRRVPSRLRTIACAVLVASNWSVVPREAVAAGWTTSGPEILSPSGQQFVISGINWYGFETNNFAAHGMWTKDYTFILDRVKALGYNTVRLPFSNEMWEKNPKPGANLISACPTCAGKHARDIMALIVNHAGAIGLHVVLDNHRSNAGDSAQQNGLWYFIGGADSFPEQSWIDDWVSVLQWMHGIGQTKGSTDTVTVNYLAADGFPTVLGFDLRNEPHTVCDRRGCDYLGGATWGAGDGIDPAVNPNPNPFAPTCVAAGTCHDWRLAAQRAGDTLLGEAAANGWEFPLIIVEGISQYPAANGNPANGPYEFYWWGGALQGVNGNASNPGAPIVLNAAGNAGSLGPAVNGQVVYSPHDYGPSLFGQVWFNADTCYASGCAASSLADVWTEHWAFLNVGDIDPGWPGHAAYPWSNTGTTPYAAAPVFLGEFGTGSASADLSSSGPGSQGQWFTDLVNFIQSSYALTPTNDSGIPVQSLHWAYWSLNANDSYALLETDWTSLSNPTKELTFLCAIQRGPFAVPAGSGAGQCGSTGPLPAPEYTPEPGASAMFSAGAVLVAGLHFVRTRSVARSRAQIRRRRLLGCCGEPQSGKRITGSRSRAMEPAPESRPGLTPRT